ncbi:MAG: HNH endonuclease [Patescibacteria group bacterium]|nr:HNH endonuclease [Patescibacteria group bacterium]
MRTEFSAKVKANAALRANGSCEECGRRLRTGDFHYDHDIPDALGGEAIISNCRVLCRSCHGNKTATADVPRIAKAKRNYLTSRGIKKPRSITSWRKFNGEIVRAGRAR